MLGEQLLIQPGETLVHFAHVADYPFINILKGAQLCWSPCLLDEAE